MPDLATFQKEFAQALVADGELMAAFRSPAFAVYRNTTARGAVEALRASFPTIDELLGEEMFTGVALDYRRDVPPAGPVLSDYGSEFPAWLGQQPWTSELPYVADVARLDWLWLESFLSAADRPMTPADGPGLRLHPATRFAWLETPALTIWEAHHGPEPIEALEPEWREEGALFTRPGLEVRVEPVDPATHALLCACAATTRLDECVDGVASAYPSADIPAILQRLVASSALIIQN